MIIDTGQSVYYRAFFTLCNGPAEAGPFVVYLAAKATDPAQKLPDGVAIGVAIGVTREEKHRATSFSEFVSRGQLGL